MKWFKKSDDWRHYSLFSSNLPPPTGTVAHEVFNTKKIYMGDELEHPVWKSDWFDTRYDNREYQFSEYCLFVRAYNYSISVIWEK